MKWYELRKLCTSSCGKGCRVLGTVFYNSVDSTSDCSLLIVHFVMWISKSVLSLDAFRGV